MSGLRYTLLSDGTSDRALLFAIRWALQQRDVRIDKEEIADVSGLMRRHSPLKDRLAATARLYGETDLLFVHRDAEKEPSKVRVREVVAAAETCNVGVPVVPVVPVRMTEAWLLIDEQAIRRASENPNGRMELKLPAPAKLEGLPDAKEVLFDLLRTASGRSGHRGLTSKDLGKMRHRVAELTSDWAPLRKLPSFRAFEAALDGEPALERFRLAAAGR